MRQPQKEWKVDGVDAASRRKFEELNSKYGSQIKGDSNFEALLAKGDDFRDGHIFHLIHEGGVEEDRFNRYKGTELDALVAAHQESFKKIKSDVLGSDHLAVTFTESTYEFAIDNAKEGGAVILDLVPILEGEKSGYNVVKALKKYADENGFKGEIVTVGASCSVDKILDHMNKRNAGKDLTQRRGDMRPFLQYAHMHEAVDGSGRFEEVNLGVLEEANDLYGGGADIVSEVLGIMDVEGRPSSVSGAVANQNFRRIFRNSNFFQTHVHLSYAYL